VKFIRILMELLLLFIFSLIDFIIMMVLATRTCFAHRTKA